MLKQREVAELVMCEMSAMGKLLKLLWKKATGIGPCLIMEEEIFLLSLCLEALEWPNVDYI